MGNDKQVGKKRQISWGENEIFTIDKSENMLENMPNPKKQKVKINQEIIESLIRQKDYKGLLSYCKGIALESKRAEQDSKLYGKDEYTDELIKDEISHLLCSLNYFIFQKACRLNDIDLMQFLSKHFTEYDLQDSIAYDDFASFRTYLSLYKASYNLKKYDNEEFISGIKIFLSIVDNAPNTLDAYIKNITRNYRANDEMRKDFAKAYKQAKEEGIIKKDIDIVESIIKEQEIIQQEYNGKKHINRPIQEVKQLVSCREEESRRRASAIIQKNLSQR